MLRIGICDDSADARVALRAALERALERRRSGADTSFFEFSSGEGLLRWLGSHAGELDLVFLDIEMGELNGMETARRLREADEGLLLVFVTGYTDYVFDGYSVGALGFLCRSGETLYRIPKKSILYFASDRRQVTCVSAARTYTFYGKLDDVERDVGESFVRVHQRYLVRTAAVERMEGSQVFVGGEALPVSRACRSAALAALARTALEG